MKHLTCCAHVSRLPVKHCLLNPIELARAGFKNFVRRNNTDFRLSEVRNLAFQWIRSLTAGSATAYIDHVLKIEPTLKASDQFIEQIEGDLVDWEDDVASEEEIFEWVLASFVH